MLYKNFEIHGCAQILNGENGGVVIRRVPENVYNALETDEARRMCRISTGIEIRFAIESGDAVLKIKKPRRNWEISGVSGKYSGGMV